MEKFFPKKDSFCQEGVKCEGPSILVLTKITPELIQKFIKAVTTYCVIKENTCKNITSWIVASLESFSQTALKNGEVSNATLHIKDPRDNFTYGWLDTNENLLTIRILPVGVLPTEYICKTGKVIQELTALDKIKFTIKIVSILAGGWDKLIPEFDQISDFISGELCDLFDDMGLLKETIQNYIINRDSGEKSSLSRLKDLLLEFKSACKGKTITDSASLLDYSKDIFTSEDKENLTKILKKVWLDHLKSDFSHNKCCHNFVNYYVKTQDKGCSLCKTQQYCRFHCTGCRSTFCRTCFDLGKDWETCPDYHSFEFTSFFFSKECERCCTTISGRGFQDKECGIYLHVGCGPYKLFKSKNNEGNLSCMCGTALKLVDKKKAQDCDLCSIRSQGGMLCSKCNIKVCEKCLTRNLAL